MRVLVDGSIFLTAPSGGSIVYLRELLPRLSNLKDLEVELLLPKGVETEVPHVKQKTDWMPTGSWFPKGRVKTYLGKIKRGLEAKLWSVRVKNKSELLYHTIYYHVPPDSKWPVISTIHDMTIERFPEFYPKDFLTDLGTRKRESIQKSQRLIAISEQTKKDIVSLCNIHESQIDVVYHGINLDLFNPTPVSMNEDIQERISHRPYLLFVGGRNHHKNFAALLEAYASSPFKMHYPLVVAGFAWNEEEKEWVRKWGLSSSVILIENPPVNQLVSLYQNAKVFVYPSLYEGFGMPVLEAMACGTPVVTSGVGCLLEVGGKAALYFDPKNTDSIQKKIEEALNPTTSQELITKGLAHVKEFTWEKAAQKTFDSYKRALSS